MNRQSWTPEVLPFFTQEDEAICRLVAQFGFNDWTQISHKLKDAYGITKRTGKQCRERWYNHLNPAVNKQPWSTAEEEHLFELHRLHGNRWKDISRNFIGR
jgi:transcriptional activator Myb